MHEKNQKVETVNKKNVFLIYSGTSYFGDLLIRELKKHDLRYEIGTARLENKNEIVNEIKRVFPTRILCMTEILDISWIEANKIDTIRKNLVGQLNLADAANEFDIHCTILTSGEIYSFDEKHPPNSGVGFTENDEPNFSGNFYSSLAISAEKILKYYPKVNKLFEY